MEAGSGLPADGRNRSAFVFYATDDNYGVGVLVFVHLLRALGIRDDADLVVLHLRLSPWITAAMRDLGMITREVRPLHPLHPHRNPYFRHCLVKLRLFQLTEYERVLFVDADAIPLKSLDDLLSFPLRGSVAAPPAYWLEGEPQWTSAMLLAKPSDESWSRVLRHVSGVSRRGDGGYFDMTLLNAEFGGEIDSLPSTALVLNSEWEDRERPNYFPDPIAAYSTASVVHFTALGKPWTCSPAEARALRPNAYPAFYDLWERWHAARTAVTAGARVDAAPRAAGAKTSGRSSDSDHAAEAARLARAAMSHGAMQKPEELGALIELITGRKLETVVEIGTARGGTLFVWCRIAEPDAAIVSIDLPGAHFGTPEGAEDVSVLASFAEPSQSLHLLRADSASAETREALQRVLAGRPIDLLFIDGDHTFRGARSDFVRYAPLVREGGLVVFHDILPAEPEVEVSRLWRLLREHHPDRCSEVVRTDPRNSWGGFGVFRWPGTEVVRPLLESLTPLGEEGGLASTLTEPVEDIETVVGSFFTPRGDEVITAVMRSDGVWERFETAYLHARLRPGDTFVDVGAHVGYFTVLGSRAVGPTGTVIALEPEGRNRDCLRLNLRRHGCGNVTVLPYAAHASRGWMSLALDEVNRGGHFLVPAGESATLVRCIRLDESLPERVDVVKIDAQGFDHDVVAGLERTVARNPQIAIVCELSPSELDRRGVHVKAVLDGYEKLGLRMSLFDELGRLQTTTADAVERLVRARPHPDFSLVLEPAVGKRWEPPHPDWFPRVAGDLEVEEGSEGLVVTEAGRGRVHVLNHTAAFVFALCTGSQRVGEIAERVRVTFGLAEPPTADVERVLERLHTDKLVV